MTAPTEAEIRKAIKAARPPDSKMDIGDWVYSLAAPIRYLPPQDDFPALAPGLWDDLRPSQVDRLNELLEWIYEKSDVVLAEAVAKIEEYVVEAALTFAAEHPDAPRKRQLIPA